MTSKERYSIMQQTLRTCFEPEYQAWREADLPFKYYPTIFCDLYDKLMQACEVMKGVDNAMISEAFDDAFNGDVKIMCAIQQMFKEVRIHEEE